MTARRPNDFGLSSTYFSKGGIISPVQVNSQGPTNISDVHGRIGKLDTYRGLGHFENVKTATDNGTWIKTTPDADKMESKGQRNKKDKDPDTTAQDLLDKAKQSLEELRLNEAEEEFLQTTAFVQEKGEDNRKLLIESYLGLSEVCTRKSRAFRQSPLEWFWLCVHASTLLSEVVDLCRAELADESDNQTVEWYNAQIKFAESRGQSILDVLGRTLHNWMNEDWRLVDPNHYANLFHVKTPLTPKSRFPLSSSPHAGGLKPYQSGFMNHAFSIESLHDGPMKLGVVVTTNVNWFKRIEYYCHRRLESNNVKDITSEVYNLTEIPEIKSSPSESKIEIETISEETDLDLALEAKEMKEDDEDEEEEEVITVETFDINDCKDLRDARIDSVVKDYSLMYELASSDVDTSGWEFFLEKRKDCVVRSVIETIPQHNRNNTVDTKQESCDELDTTIVETFENCNGHRESSSDTMGASSPDSAPEEPDKKKEEERFSPLRENALRLTVARSFELVAQKLTQMSEYTKSENLYEDVLAILEDIKDGTVKMLRFNALLLQNTGLLCFKQGNRHNGMKNLEKALKIYRDLKDIEAHRDVAQVLIDLGNAFADDLNDDALYDKVIAAICEFFEREASDEENTGSSTPSSSHESVEDLEQLRRISEAVNCYSEALMVLEKNEVSQKHIVAMAMRKLGDCHFVQKEYTESLEWYEKALNLHRTSGFHGKDAMLENAHVLSMLGVCTFMVHVYPRASHIFELALHMVKHAHGLTMYTFLHSLLMSLLGITYYKMKAYHKCASMCSRAFETFWNLYAEKIPDLPQYRFWLVCQNLYILGNTYNVLNLHHKATRFLEIGRAFMRESVTGEKRQHMRILQILGDCYFAQYDYKTALVYYNEALDIGDKVTSSTESEAFEKMDEMTTSNEDLDMALHNQLLSRSADAHISMKQYQNAVHYLEQARDIQDVLEDDIKGDLVSTLHQLGQMHSMAGDVDKAIESYKESLDVFRELHNGKLAPEMVITLGNLATMCYVKACICEDIDSELEMILLAEQYFQAALKEELDASVCVKYANFLYSQANYDDAIMYLEDSLKSHLECDNEMDIMDRTLFFPRPYTSYIVYGGLERVTLPEPLQEEVDAQEEAIMPTSVLAYYILVLSYKMVGQFRHSERALMNLMGEVYARDIPFLHSVLGYAFMELGLFYEAAREFRMAVCLDNEYNLALDNYCLCLCLHTYNVLERAFSTIFVHCNIWNEEHKINKRVAYLLGSY